MPRIMRGVSCSPKISTPKNKAVTGSKAPRIAVGVEPMYCMAFVIVTNEITVGKTASEIAFTHNKGVGISCNPVQNFNRTT